MVTGKLKKRAKRVTKTMVFFHIIIVFIAFSRINFENLHIVYAPEILFALFILTSRPLRYWVALCICIGPQRIMLDEKSYGIAGSIGNAAGCTQYHNSTDHRNNSHFPAFHLLFRLCTRDLTVLHIEIAEIRLLEGVGCFWLWRNGIGFWNRWCSLIMSKRAFCLSVAMVIIVPRRRFRQL